MTYPDTENNSKSPAGLKEGRKTDSGRNPAKKEKKEMKVKKEGSSGQSAQLPPKEDFSQWYHELLMSGEIIDNRYPVKGMCVWFPFGFAIK